MNLTRLQQIGVSAAILCILAALAVGIYRRSHPPTPMPPTSVYTPPTSSAPPTTIVVQVSGAVANAGVYTLPKGSRVQQAIEAAGGMLTTADARGVNLAARLEDGQKIDVPWAETSTSPAPTEAKTSVPRVNLNTATAEQLEQLPGIGPTLARAIVKYRQENGLFRSVEDLDAVPGIGSKRVEQMKPYVTVR